MKEWSYWLLLGAALLLFGLLWGDQTAECLKWRDGLAYEGDRQHAICPDDYIQWRRKGTFPQR